MMKGKNNFKETISTSEASGTALHLTYINSDVI